MYTNSKRSLLQASYSPIKTDPESVGQLAIPKFGFVSGLQISAEEAELLWNELENPDSPSELRESHPALQLIQDNFLTDTTVAIALQMELAADLDPIHLQQLAAKLIAIRTSRLEQVATDVRELAARFQELNNENASKTSEEAPIPLPDSGEVTLLIGEESGLNISMDSPDLPVLHTQNWVREIPSIGDLLNWFEQEDRSETRTDRVIRVLRPLFPDFGNIPPGDIQKVIALSIENLKKILAGFQEGLKVKPHGILHLERLEFTPDGEERGELAYTAPLTPGEVLTLTTKESVSASRESLTAQESEVARLMEMVGNEKEEVATGVELERKTEFEFGFGSKFSTKFAWDKNSISSELSVNTKLKEAGNAKYSEAIKRTRDLTRKVSNNYKQNFKQSFKVSGTESSERTASRTIKNPTTDRVLRVDYYRMMRRWKIDLHRYGVRITYDINVPEPGSEIVAQYRKLQEIKAALAVPFEHVERMPSHKYYYVWKLAGAPDMQAVNEEAEKWGVQVAPAPREMLFFSESKVKTWMSKSGAEAEEFVLFEFRLPEGYLRKNRTRGGLVVGSDIHVNAVKHKDFSEAAVATVEDISESHDNRVQITVRKRYATSIRVDIGVLMELPQEAKDVWVQKTYDQIRTGAKERFEDWQKKLQSRKEWLEQQLEVQDTLSLRRLEHEELMKNTLRWMFGPGFRFILPGMLAYNPQNGLPNASTYYDQVTRSVRDDQKDFSLHQTVLQHGELIKFLHQAIEWENMTYFLYPYFWSNPAEWMQKLAFRHPDPAHEAFLKAGSARVILPLRPGFEEKFLWFLRSGKMEIPEQGAEPDYITLAKEMQFFAQTNYPWLRSANPEDNSRPLLTWNQRKTWEEMQEIMEWLEKFKKEKGKYPTSLAELDTLSPAPVPAMAARKDPWGGLYQYKYPGNHADYDLSSYGSNKKKGVEENSKDQEEEDINSWAESSRIATWYDYTPTSALDIGVKSEVITPPLPTPPPAP